MTVVVCLIHKTMCALTEFCIAVVGRRVIDHCFSRSLCQ